MSLEIIEKLTKEYAAAEAVLRVLLTEAEADIKAVEAKYQTRMVSAAIKLKGIKDQLEQAINDNPKLFVKPRTMTIRGIKIGLKKMPGKLEFIAENVVKIINKQFKDKADVLLKTEQKPIAKALENLSAAELKKLGVTVTSDTDVAVITNTTTEMQKRVAKFLKEHSDLHKAAEVA